MLEIEKNKNKKENIYFVSDNFKKDIVYLKKKTKWNNREIHVASYEDNISMYLLYM